VLLTYQLANLVIVLGYFTLGIVIIPVTKWENWWTPVAATGFFITCGVHHAMDIHTGSNMAMSMGIGDRPSTFMVVDDLLQAAAVWTFFIGLLVARHTFGVPWRSTEP
jgi:hypothetical protein